jgi:hypothetical protein
MPPTNIEMDNVSVDFIFEATGSDENLDFAMAETPGAALHDFWNSSTGRVATLGSYLSSLVDRTSNAVTIEWYDITAHLDGSPAGAPFRIDQATIEESAHDSSVDLNPALALCGAVRRAYGSDAEHVGTTRPRARDRGRIYVGPLNNWCQDLGTGRTRAAVASDLVISMERLAATHNSGNTNQFNWVQWSRKNASVGQIEFVATQYGLAIQRRRTDEQNTRVLSWTSV